MSNVLLQIFVLLRKELLMTLKDKRVRIILVMPIILQTILFGFVATFDVNHCEYVLLDEDRSKRSRELVRLFDGCGIFERVGNLSSNAEIEDIILTKKALFVLHIGRNFERSLETAKEAPVQIILDGRNSNVAGVVMGYAETIIRSFNQNQSGTKPSLVSRAWFNPNLETRYGILSGLTAILAVIQVLSIAGQSISREKEQGTFDQLLVSPIEPAAILIGKAVPPVLVGLSQSGLVLLVAVFGFGIPFAGSYCLLFFSLLIYNFSLVGIGLCVSTCAKNMQQALLYNFTLLMPMILLSGFATPISSMPEFFQAATYLNPVRYGVDFTQRIFLEGATLSQIKYDLFSLLGIACVTLISAMYLFRRKGSDM